MLCVGWPVSSIQTCYRPISALKTVISATRTRRDTSFRHPVLNNSELKNGCKLGLDSYADTSCSGRHAFVEEFIEGKLVTATGFSSSLGSMKNLPMANVLYAYDKSDGRTIILEHNNTIYLGGDMDDSLANPIQSEEVGIRIDLRPKKYHTQATEAQTITLVSGEVIPIQYDGVLPFIPIRRPTSEEIEHCQRVQLTSKFDWDPFSTTGTFSKVDSETRITADHIINQFELSDPISSELSFIGLDPLLLGTPLLQDDYTAVMSSSLGALKAQQSRSLTPEKLSSMWGIGLKTARRTLLATTHECIRTTGLLAKRFKTDKSQLRYKQLSKRYGSFYVDYLKFEVKSVRQFIGGTLYTNKLGFKKFFPCTSETSEETGSTLRSFIELVGLPPSLHSDNHPNFKEGIFKKLLRKFGVPSTFTEPHSPWQNRAEPAIGEVKRHARRLMQRSNTPIRLWCFCFEYSADLLSLCATGRFDLQGRTPYEAVLNYTPDISEYASYTWFQWCWFYNERTKNKQLCRWLGPAHHIGQALCSYILLENGEFIARSSVIGIENHDLTSLDMISSCRKFMKSVESKIGNEKVPIYDASKPDKIYFSAFGEHDDDDDNLLPYGEEIVDQKESEINETYIEALDTYIGAKVVVPGKDSIPVIANIRNRKRDSVGNVIGTPNSNPILDSRIYDLEFPDGRVEEYSVNTIVENLVEQVDNDGWDSGLLKEIIAFRSNPDIAVQKGENSHTTSLNGTQRPVITTKGWDVQVKWEDQSTNWIPLALIKEANPIEVAEFAVANKYADEPAFKWWVNTVLKKRKRLLARVKSRCRKGSNSKFGIEVPKTVDEALRLDKENGNTLWHDAIKKEMENSRVAFNLLGVDDGPPVGFKEITCHMIFDVKMDLTRKARYVAGGHLTDPPSSMTYASVVSRDSVRIAFLIAALNDLEILSGDIQNAYLNSPTKEEVFFYAGDEWKSNKGRAVVIVRALYGLKSSALAWRNHLADILTNYLGFKPTLADPDVWLKPETDALGSQYYSYILVYVDDILIIHKSPNEYMEMLKEKYTVKPASIGEPKIYLGADIGKVSYADGSYAWSMSSDSYVKEAIKNVKARLRRDGLEYNKKLSDINYSPQNPFSAVNYRPELDTSHECSNEQVTLFQNLIGVLRWIVELGRIDIAFEVSSLSKFLASPRTGHLVQAIHIFKYLDIHHSNDIAFDPMYQQVNSDQNTKQKIQAMKELYADAIEDLPHNAPKPRGRPVQVNCFVDSDHAGDRMTRRSQSGILLYLNSAPIMWYSKRQNTVESSTFGSEFVALRISTDLVISLRYKLRMFGIPIDGPANLFCDNEAVYKNASFAESQLKKKHQSICFHRVRECVAANIVIPHKVDTNFNLADLLTKSLPALKRIALRARIMFTSK